MVNPEMLFNANAVRGASKYSPAMSILRWVGQLFSKRSNIALFRREQ